MPISGSLCVGAGCYQTGYADTQKDVRGARYTHPLAVLKPLGIMGSFIACTVVCVSMMLYP